MIKDRGNIFLNVLFINALVLAAFVYFIINGIYPNMVHIDKSYIVLIITILFFYGSVKSITASYKVAALKKLVDEKAHNKREILKIIMDCDHDLDLSKQNNSRSLRLILLSLVSQIKNIAWSLVLLGLIGTVVGFIMSLLTLDLSAVGDIEKLPEIMFNVSIGMGTALYTTAVGSIGNLILLSQYNLILRTISSIYVKLLKD